jgi:hypothetical protein
MASDPCALGNTQSNGPAPSASRAEADLEDDQLHSRYRPVSAAIALGVTPRTQSFGLVDPE